MGQKLFRAILIDPTAQTVTEISTSGEPSMIREVVAASGLDHFRIADHDDSWDYGWVDGTGLKGGQIHAFKFRNNKDPIAGRCVLIGVDKNTGDTTDAKFDREILRSEIEWLGLIKPEVIWDKNGDVSRAIIIYSRVNA